MSDIERVAQVLRDAEAARMAVGPVSDLVEGGLTLDTAHAVCESNIARREAAGERIVGFKVGFTNLAVREKMGLPDSTYGYLLESMVLASGGTLDLGEVIAPKIESEICVRLGRDLAGPGVTAEDVLEAADAVRASFEICDARIIDWKCPYPDFLADNGFSSRIVLGESDWRPDRRGGHPRPNRSSWPRTARPSRRAAARWPWAARPRPSPGWPTSWPIGARACKAGQAGHDRDPDAHHADRAWCHLCGHLLHAGPRREDLRLSHRTSTSTPTQ